MCPISNRNKHFFRKICQDTVEEYQESAGNGKILQHFEGKYAFFEQSLSKIAQNFGIQQMDF